VNANRGGPIVVGVDDSPPSYAALDWAIGAADRRDLALHLLHVVEWQPHGIEPGAESRRRDEAVAPAARERVRTAAPDLPATDETVDGDPAGVLVDRSRHAAMIVVGNRGLGGFRSLLTGSVGVQTAAHAQCPVVVVRPHLREPSRAEEPVEQPARHAVGRVVVGVDGSDLSDAAVRFAFEEATLRGIGLTAVHAWRYPASSSPGEMIFAMYPRTDLGDVENKILARALAPYRERRPDVPVLSVLAQGSPAAVLVHESVGAELLVVGSRGHGGFAGLLLGSVSDAAIRHAGCPVAVIR
jgi:nucleotide-binding universal stress UspA family protein